MTQASKEPGDLGVLGLYRGTPISYEFPLMAVAKKNSEFGVCAFPLVTVLGRFPLGQRAGKAGSVRPRSWLVVLCTPVGAYPG